MKRWIAMLLALCMLLSLTACVAQPAENETDAPETTQVTAATDPDTLNREQKEQIIDLMGDVSFTPEELEKLSDEEVDALVQELLKGLDEEKIVNLKSENPMPEVEVKEEYYNEEGGMDVPFDVAYPELVEGGHVPFSNESLLVKLKSDKLTNGLKLAGVVALEETVPLKDCAWYTAKLLEGTDAYKALSAVRELDEVLLAELNYVVESALADSSRVVLSADTDSTETEGNGNGNGNGNNKPKEQWHLKTCGIQNASKVQKFGGGDPSVIVAVIDTGVDYDHEDLAQNIWKNTAEIPDNGIDDDKNGYVDDYYGVDIVSGRGNGDDTNGHGTHVAGIIAAQNNKMGVMGIAYDTKIMPVKAASHSGYFLQGDIAKAVQYACENGAEVINMSFGGTACSIAVQDALANAYTQCVLVASAGNSGMPNEPTDFYPALPNYPGALTYVLGVMSINQSGVESGFTNWDVEAFNGREYELYAPGEAIVSTLPNNTYGALSGTSMAAPMVSACAAILRSEFSDRDTYPTKFIYGQLSSTSGDSAICCDPEKHTVNGGPHNIPQIVNLYDALTKLPKPEVGVQEYHLFDLPKYSSKNNGDGVIDAGETIALGLVLRNRWGMSENTLVTIDTLSQVGMEDPYITIHNPTVNYGSVGTYSTQDCGKVYTDELFADWVDPFLITIAEDCPNDYIFTLNITVTCENALDEEDETVYKSEGEMMEYVRNGYILPSVIEEDMVLTKDNLYIIPNATIIEEGVTVKVMPGTHIQFWSDDADDPYADSYIAYLLVNGKFLVEGTKEEPVYIYPSELMRQYGVEIGSSPKGYVSLEYADVTNFFYAWDSGGNHTGTGNHIDRADHCTFRNNYSGYAYYRYLSGGVVSWNYMQNAYIGDMAATDCVFYKLAFIGNTYLQGTFDRCMFAQCGIDFRGTHQNCVFLGNAMVDQTNPGKHYNSSLALQKELTIEQKPTDFKVYYHKESGTTYLKWYAYNGNSSYTEDRMEIIAEYVQEAFGGGYFVPEDLAEYQLVRQKLGTVNTMVTKTADGFVWSDGTPVQPEFPVATLPGTIYDYYFWCLNSDGEIGYDNPSYMVYEIPGRILPEDITFREYTALVDLETTYQLAPQCTPIQLPTDQFLYESSDESVLTVSDTGLVTPVGLGTADVWVYSIDKAVKNRVTFEVRDYVALESLRLPSDAVKLFVGESAVCQAVLTPSDTTRRNVVYTSSDESVVKAENGVITAVGKGNATITATCEGLTATLEVTTLVRATGLTYVTHRHDRTMESMDTSLPELKVTPANADLDLEWKSYHEDVLTVENGKLVMKKDGYAHLYATDRNSGLRTEMDFYITSSAPVIQKDVIAVQLGSDPVSLPQVAFAEGAAAEPQWKILDPAVAELKDGKIQFNGAGITTLRVTDPRTGLSDEISIYVTEGTIPRVKKLVGYNGYYVALMEDGSAYHWYASTSTKADPKLMSEHAAAVSWDYNNGSCIYLLLTDGTVARYNSYATKVNTPYTLPEGMKAVDLAGGCYYSGTTLYGSMHILTDTGEVYALGENTYGVLGTGNTQKVTELTKVSFNEPVVRIERYLDIAYFLTESGCLYVSGGSALQSTIPVMIARNVTWLDDGGEYYVSGDSLGYFTSGSTAPTVLGLDCSAYTVLGMDKHYRHEGLAIKDGKLYRVTDDNTNFVSNTVIMTNVTTAVDGLSAGNFDYCYVVTEDGLLFGCGFADNASPSDNTFLGMTSKSYIDKTQGLFLPVVQTPENLRALEDNLENGVLTADSLVLTFNKQLQSAKVTLYENGTPMVMYQSIQDEQLTLTPTVGFAEGKEYRLVVGTATTGVSNVQPAEEIVIEFTYAAPKTEETDPEETVPEETTPEETVPEETVPQEKVIYEAIVDESIQRILTPESIAETLNAYIAETQYNPYFYGNAILNPVSTDFEVSHWLRLQAPTISAGSTLEIPLGGNWWGTVNETAIGLQMVDYTDFVTYGKFNYAPYLTEAPENTFPFVTSVKLINSRGEEVTKVGNEKVTFRVTFNRDMDTSIPLVVRFGSAYPYGDYEIGGKYVNARTWEGEYTLNTLIENGYQYFSIQNGCSATEDLPLQWDLMRFGFEIDTTAAQALIMQGVAEDEGIQLTWTQDDFDTLMGYNVYRSTSEDGLYTMVNTTTIPADTKTFFDTNVEPGVVYYYNFTVVKTDLTESEPSGKIVIMSKDTMAPSVYHSGVATATMGKNLVINATISDNLNVAYANLYYRTVGQSAWKTARMNRINSKYVAIIPAADVTMEGLEYYIEAFDGVSSTTKGSVESPYTVVVQESVESNDMGDVNGDGVIGNIDALMLLQAIHDKYNMNAEQFARADLDGNGKLEAFEALRILQYISGTVGYVDLRK